LICTNLDELRELITKIENELKDLENNRKKSMFSVPSISRLPIPSPRNTPASINAGLSYPSQITAAEWSFSLVV
ncbi:hypothetical protein Celaphus_00018312, partial [Cervus elaphus hippelaphus]